MEARGVTGKLPNNIVILTGAGISAESGVPTFRGPDGLWEGHRVEDVATPEAFARDPIDLGSRSFEVIVERGSARPLAG